MAPMTGTAQPTMAHMASRDTRGGSVTRVAGSSSAGADDWPTLRRSAPAMKARSPAAVKMAARTSRSSSKLRKVSRISAIVDRSTALTGGRSSVTVATWSTTSTVRSATPLASCEPSHSILG